MNIAITPPKTIRGDNENINEIIENKAIKYNNGAVCIITINPFLFSLFIT